MLWILASIFVLNFVIYLFRKKMKWVCPICAAVTLTWLFVLVLKFAGVLDAQLLVLATLMGATLGGAVEKFGARFGLWWKTGTVLLGAPAVYFILTDAPAKATALLAALLIFTFLINNTFRKKGIEKNEDKFEDCCS